MPAIQVTGDDEPFLYQQDQVDASMEDVREVLNKISPIIMCIDCGEEIGAARKKAVPSATLCIECQEFKDEYKR